MNSLLDLEREVDLLLAPLAPEGEQRRALARYLELLMRWARRINLTGFRTPALALEGLMFDAVEVAPLIPEGASVMDVGAGAGGLAFTLATIRPDLALHLVEPRTKRVAFLRAARRELRPSGSISISCCRAEELPSERLGVDAAYAQAVMGPEPWLRLARRLVRSAGQILYLGSTPIEEQIELSPSVVLERERRYHLPRSGAPRCVASLRLLEGDVTDR